MNIFSINWRPAFVGMLVSLIGLCIAEVLFQGIATLRHEVNSIYNEWFIYSRYAGWERRPGFKGYVSGELRTGDLQSYLREFDGEGFFSIDSKQALPSKDLKILAIGDSSTFGWGVPTESAFPEILEGLLPHTNVINLGVNGYTSLQGYRILEREILRLKPAVVIVSFGFNDLNIVHIEFCCSTRSDELQLMPCR